MSVRIAILLLVSSVECFGQSFTFNDPAFVCQTNVASLPDVSSGRIGWWKLDDASGTNAVDSSGNGYGGTFSGLSWGTGIIGGCIVSVTNNTGISLNAGVRPYLSVDAGTNFSVTAWCSLATPTNLDARTVFSSSAASADRMIIQFTSLGYLSAGIYNGSFVVGGTLNKAFPASTWIHLALVKSGSSVTVYTNGVQCVGSANNPSTVGTVGTRIAASSFGTRGWDGSIDDVRVYSRALTAGEITTIYNWRP